MKCSGGVRVDANECEIERERRVGEPDDERRAPVHESRVVIQVAGERRKWLESVAARNLRHKMSKFSTHAELQTCQVIRSQIHQTQQQQECRFMKIRKKQSKQPQIVLLLGLVCLCLSYPSVLGQATGSTGGDESSVVPTTEVPLASSTSGATTIPTDEGAGANRSGTESTAAADFGGPPMASTGGHDGDSSANGQAQTKLKPINFTQVDEMFDAFLSEEEVVKKWKFMDAQLQDGMRSILKMVFPQIVSLSQDAKVSGDCSGGILKWILSLRNLRSWAIKMLDATGKPSAGIFEGSLTMFGNYRQCLSIRAPDEDEIEITEQFEEYFRGQFCVIHLKPWMPIKRPFYHLNSTIESLLRKNYKYYEKTLYDELAEIAIAFNFIDIRMDLCVPSTCTVADIQRVAELLSKKLEMRAKVMRCDVAPRDGTNMLNQLDRVSYYWLALPLILLATTTLSTILLALITRSRDSKSMLSNHHDANVEVDETPFAGAKLVTILECLSIGGALRDRLASPACSSTQRDAASGDDYEQESGSSDQASAGSCQQQVPLGLLRKPLPLYGLRNLFIFWFLIVQMTVELKYQYLRESLTLRNMIIAYWPFQIIVNSVLLFESLILITAFTFSYTCLESSLRDLIAYLVDKYIRLILPIITLIALTIITPLIGIDSPVWRNFVDEQSTVCKSTGYIDLFFLQNFIAYDKICLPHTWLFCVELQLIVLSIPLVLLLKKTFLSTEDSVIIGRGKLGQSGATLMRVVFIRMLKSKAGLLGVLLILAGLCVNFFTVYTNKLPPSWFYTFPDVAQKNYYFGLYLTKTWTHLSVFAVGLLAGHLCRSTIQLRNINFLKSRQSSQRRQTQQPSPAPSSSTSGHLSHLASRQSVHGSTSTIMAMENGAGLGDEHSSGDMAHSSQSKTYTSNAGKISLQLAALICMAAIIFSTYTWSTQEAPSTMVAATYDALSRLIWSLALVALMVQLCLPNEDEDNNNKYSSLARFFAHPSLTLLGRLSFLAYLISPYVHTFVLAVEEQSLFPSLFLIFHVIVGNIVITYTLAFILAIVIEQPTRRLFIRFIFRDRFRKQKINISTYYESNNSGLVPSLSSPKSQVADS